MSSEDVIHSFFVPDFRVKQDVVPGRYNYLWFTPTRTGEFRLFCSQFCGTAHSKMTGIITVMTPQDFQTWKTAAVSGRSGQSFSDLASRGRSLFSAMGCISCHGTVGRIAPPLQGLYMSLVGLRSGETVLADEQYIRESIVNPNAKIVKGYEAVMPSFQGQLSEEDLLSLLAYIKSLQHYDRTVP
jgi:cytochrome c oxidase subunit 2